MGQYWLPVNLTKKEYIDPHQLGTGLKLAEQIGSSPGTADALIVLLAAMPEARGGGDLDLQQNWHGPERAANTGPAEFPAGYQELASCTIGRWAGDNVALVGDYAEDTDLPPQFEASKIYDQCKAGGAYTDVTWMVAAVLEHELGGKFVGDGWKDFIYAK